MTDSRSSLDASMARLADGDREAFSSVFELLWPPVHRLCTRLLKNEADASDAAQDAMQRILERASEYDKHLPALPWAMAIAGWECRTLLRRRGRRKEDLGAQHERAGEHAEDAIVERDLATAALVALGELSAADRETLLATFWDEAASTSGPTLRKRRERALDRLRKAFWRLYGLD